MILKDALDYLSRMSREDPHSLYKEFVVRDTRTQINYPVEVIDEGMSPAELSFRSSPDNLIHERD